MSSQLSAHARWAAAEAEQLARFRSKFHMQRAELDSSKLANSARTLANLSGASSTPTMFSQISSTAGRLLDLRDQYRRSLAEEQQDNQQTENNRNQRRRTSSASSSSSHGAQSALIEAKSLISSIPRYVLEDDPKLTSTLKIVRASSAFGFDPTREKSLLEILDLVKRSAYAVDASRAIQFLSALQTFNPRPDRDIRVLLDNVSDGIQMGASGGELLVHEVSTLLSALLKLDSSLNASSFSNNKNKNNNELEEKIEKRKAKNAHKPLLESLTRHLVTHHTTAPINDVCRATALLTRVTSSHGRVLLHEIQSRICKEAHNLMIPPVAALDLISVCANLEPEEANQIVKFPRDIDLDADVSAPPCLFNMQSRPVSKRLMLSNACETLLTHASMLSSGDVADAFSSLKQSGYQHEVLLDRLVNRALNVVDSTSLLSIIKILETVQYFDLHKKTTTTAVPQLFDSYAHRIVKSHQQRTVGLGQRTLTFNNCLTILNLYCQAGEVHHVGLFCFLLEQIGGMRLSNSNNSNNNSNSGILLVPDHLLVRCLEIIERLELYDSNSATLSNVSDSTTPSMIMRVNKAAVKVIGNVVHELFVVRGGLSSNSKRLVHSTQKVVDAMLPVAEKDPQLLAALQPLVDE